jgi:hypothetical protein
MLHRNGEGMKALATHAMETHGWLRVGVPISTFAGLERLDARRVEHVHIRRDTRIKLGEPGLTRHDPPGLDSSRGSRALHRLDAGIPCRLQRRAQARHPANRTRLPRFRFAKCKRACADPQSARSEVVPSGSALRPRVASCIVRGSGSAAAAARCAGLLRSPNVRDHDTLELGRGIDARTAPQCAARGASRFVADDASFATGDSGAAYAEIAAQLAE